MKHDERERGEREMKRNHTKRFWEARPEFGLANKVHSCQATIWGVGQEHAGQRRVLIDMMVGLKDGKTFWRVGHKEHKVMETGFSESLKTAARECDANLEKVAKKLLDLTNTYYLLMGREKLSVADVTID
jgi:hypothetical protein